MATPGDTRDRQRSLTLPIEPSAYQYKGALFHANGTWTVLCHCPTIQQDVIVKVKQLPDFIEDAQRFIQRVNPMVRLRHENLLTPTQVFSNMSELWLVYRRHSGGPISEILASNFPQGIEDQSIVSRILLDIINGLQYMHENNMCHRNLRARNLHLGKESGRTLLTEFGDLKDIQDIRDQETPKGVHSIKPRGPYWLAPEIMFEENLEPTAFLKADVYSFAITALEIVFGEPPIANFAPAQSGHGRGGLTMVKPVSIDSYPRQCPFGKQFRDLIEPCLQLEPNARPSIRQLRNSRFFSHACTHDKVVDRLGVLLKSTESRINSNLYPPISITNHEPPPSVDTPIGDDINYDFDPNPKTNRYDSWDFSSGNQKDLMLHTFGTNNNTQQRMPNICENDSNSSKTNLSHQRSQSDMQQRQQRVSIEYSDYEVLSPLASPISIIDTDGRISKHSRTMSESGIESIVETPRASGPEEQHGRFFVERQSQSTMSEREPSFSLSVEVLDNINSGDEGDDQKVGRFFVESVADQELAEDQRAFKAENSSSLEQTPPPDPSLVPSSLGFDFYQKFPNWTTDECIQFIRALGKVYEDVGAQFREHGIDGDLFESLTDDDLRVMGVEQTLYRKKIIGARNKLLKYLNRSPPDTNIV